MANSPQHPEAPSKEVVVSESPHFTGPVDLILDPENATWVSDVVQIAFLTTVQRRPTNGPVKMDGMICHDAEVIELSPEVAVWLLKKVKQDYVEVLQDYTSGRRNETKQQRIERVAAALGIRLVMGNYGDRGYLISESVIPPENRIHELPERL